MYRSVTFCIFASLLTKSTLKMRNNYLLMLVLVMSAFFWQKQTHAQCSNTNVFYTDLTPTMVGVPATLTNIYGGEYVTVTVCSGATYTFSTAGATYDTQITLYSNSTSAFLGYDDDSGGNTTSFLSWTADFNGVIRVLVNQFDCTSNLTNTPLAVTQTTACSAGGSQCTNNNTFYVDLTPVGIGTPATLNNIYAGEYVTVTVCNGATYTFSTAGATYDTQLTIYNNTTGQYLAYSDDTGASSSSFITWTSSFNGVIRVLVDQFDCTSNSINTPLAITQTTACGGFCDPGSLFITDAGCEDNGLGLLPTINTQYFFSGGCTVNDLWVSENGGIYQAIDLSAFGLVSGESLQITDFNEGSDYAFYYTLSDGSVSDDFFYFTSLCGGGCTAFAPDITDLGCVDEGSGLLPAVDIAFDFIGSCSVQTLFGSIDGGAFQAVDVTAFNLTAGSTLNFFDLEEGALYELYYQLNDGTVSPSIVFVASACANCTAVALNVADAGCENNGFGLLSTASTAYFINGDCTVESLFLSANGGAFEELDLSTFALMNGDEIQIIDLQPGTNYLMYYSLSDGTVSDLEFYTTPLCETGCDNLLFSYIPTGCEDGGNGVLVPSGTVLIDYDGDCFVSGVYTSVDGGPFEFLDLSSFGLTQGPLDLFFNIQDASYEVFYELSDGSLSTIVTFQTETCESGETICDCAGNQIPAEALVWLGDGFLDEGASFWNGTIPVDFNCATWGFDCGDELAIDELYVDPYGVCEGNLPPANGCVDELCYPVDVIIATDCYIENAVFVLNENGDVVFTADEFYMNAEETEYTFSLCLPAGCYTFRVLDAAGDGISGFGCANAGYFTVVDGTTGEAFFFVDGGNFTTLYQNGGCLGPETTCDNLDLILAPADCFSALGAALLPSVDLEFSYTGGCTVASVFISEDGGEFEEIDVTAEEWSNGEVGQIVNLQPNSSYQFYYVLNDGAVSFLYNYTSGDCTNEVTICDCDGTPHSIGVTAWLGDGFADNGTYLWSGQEVNFNCASWGYDCGDIEGAPSIDPFGVCEGNLPPFNGCNDSNEILGCTDPAALNFNPLATVNDGSCVYNLSVGCTDPEACNYLASAVIDNGTCEYLTCAGCTDDLASNFDPSATIDDGSCIYIQIPGCTDPAALNFSPVATQDNGSCVYQCFWPTISYDAYCQQQDANNFYIDLNIGALGNGAPYTITNSYNQQQLVLNLSGSFTMGPFPNDQQVVIYVTSFIQECSLTSGVLVADCGVAGIFGCTDPDASNYNPLATINDGTCEYESIEGCTDPEALNYNPLATFDDGSCVYVGVAGCTDPEALNYNPLATVDDGSCVYDVSVEEAQANTFAVYPNPANERVFVVSKQSAGLSRVVIVDGTGRTVYSDQKVLNANGPLEISTAQIAAGNYIVIITNDESTEHIQLVVRH
jgi:hypothetical protein